MSPDNKFKLIGKADDVLNINSVHGGFGSNNMIVRARRINAKIDLAPIAGGAILTIHLP
jgi:hypothetical protein